MVESSTHRSAESGIAQNEQDSVVDPAVSLFEIGAAVLRNRWVVIGSSFLFLLFAIVWALASPRVWTTDATFITQQEGPQTGAQLRDLAGRFGLNVNQGDRAQQSPTFYVDLLGSRTILEGVARDLLTDSTQDGAGSRVRSRLELDSFASDRHVPTVVGWLRDEVVEASSRAESGIVRIEVTTPWPRVSLDISQELIEQVHRFNIETRQTRAAAERRFTEERFEEAKAEFRASEDELKQFLEQNRQFQNSPELQFEHDRLRRRLVSRQEIYTSLEAAYEQARVAEVRTLPVITIIDPPRLPSRPEPRRVLLKGALGLLFGFIVGGLIAVTTVFWRSPSGAAREEFVAALRETREDLKRRIGLFGRPE